MPRKFFKRLSPSPEQIRQNKALRGLAHLLEDPNLFHLNRHSIARAVAIGLGVSMLPIFGHIFLAGILAWWRKANVAISVLLVWVSNPLTFPIILFLEYKLGILILQQPDSFSEIHWNWSWMISEIGSIGAPLLVGGVSLAILFSFFGYYGTFFLWHQWVQMKWKRRRRSQKAARKHSEG